MDVSSAVLLTQWPTGQPDWLQPFLPELRGVHVGETIDADALVSRGFQLFDALHIRIEDAQVAGVVYGVVRAIVLRQKSVERGLVVVGERAGDEKSEDEKNRIRHFWGDCTNGREVDETAKKRTGDLAESDTYTSPPDRQSGAPGQSLVASAAIRSASFCAYFPPTTTFDSKLVTNGCTFVSRSSLSPPPVGVFWSIR